MVSDQYAAGFFDGEGTVYAATRNKGFKNPTIIVAIANTARMPLLEFQNKWGGSICARFKILPKNRQQQYQWTLAPRNAYIFLKAIQPHLIIKREVASVAIEFCEITKIPLKERMDYSKLRPSKIPGKMTRAGVMRQEYSDKLRDLHAKIRRLNSAAAPINALREYTTHPPGNPV